MCDLSPENSVQSGAGGFKEAGSLARLNSSAACPADPRPTAVGQVIGEFQARLMVPSKSSCTSAMMSVSAPPSSGPALYTLCALQGKTHDLPEYTRYEKVSLCL